MSILNYKLKRIKGVVKDWEKKQPLNWAKVVTEIELEIQSLLISRPLGILYENEIVQLSSLKCCKESYLAHELLTSKLKSRSNWICEGDANKILSQFGFCKKEF